MRHHPEVFSVFSGNKNCFFPALSSTTPIRTLTMAPQYQFDAIFLPEKFSVLAKNKTEVTTYVC